MEMLFHYFVFTRCTAYNTREFTHCNVLTSHMFPTRADLSNAELRCSSLAAASELPLPSANELTLPTRTTVLYLMSMTT